MLGLRSGFALDKVVNYLLIVEKFETLSIVFLLNIFWYVFEYYS
jgi:hypothetical protein